MEIERDERYRFAGNYSLPVTVSRISKPGSETVQADLLDLSRRGLKLSSPTELVNQEAVQLHVSDDELGLNLTSPAQVRWIRQDTETKSWNVGCEIKSEICEDVLINLAKRRLLDRRNSVRHSVTGEAQALWELSEDSVPVQLLNLSEDGFCLVSDRPTQVGLRLRLTLSDDDGDSLYEIRSRAKWQQGFENGYLIGCELAKENVFDLFNHFLASRPESSARRGRRGRRVLPLLAGVTIMAIVAAVYLSLLVF